MGQTLITAAVSEPLETADVMNYLRVEGDEHKDDIQAIIASVRDFTEEVMWRALIKQTWEITLDFNFPKKNAAILLPKPPLQSVTSITYLDTAEASQTLAATKYIVDTTSEPGRIMPAIDESWPATAERFAAVTVRFVAGYGNDHKAIPSGLKGAMKMLVSHWFENRESVGRPMKEQPWQFGSMLQQFRVNGFY